MPFDKNLDLKLIKLVEENPVLYKSKHENWNSDADSREVSWQKIGDALKKPASVCKTRWVNIRDNMRRKVRLRERHDYKLNRVACSKYKYEDNLTFVIPHLKGSKYQTESMEYLDDDDSMVEQVFVDDEQYEQVREMKPNLSNLIVLNSNDESSSNINNLSMSQDRGDPVNVFLEAVGSTLRNLNPYYLNQAKSKIFQVVQDCELQQIVNKGERPSTSQENFDNN